MKIAYLILAHAHPQQLGRLVQRLAGPEARFYIHVDANTPSDTFAAMQAAAPQARWIQRQPCRWGGFSLVDATLRLVEQALAEDCDWLVLLSGQDYPVKPPAQITSTLAASPYVAHLDVQPDFAVDYRWQAWHFEQFNGTPLGKLLQKIQRTLARIGIRRKLPTPLSTVQAGSQWWMLSAPAAQAVLDLLKAQPHITTFFKTTLVPDEMFFQTLLSHLYPASQIGPALRQIEWEDGSWSPRSFATEDADRLHAGPALFARKFAPDGVATAALDQFLDQGHRTDNLT